MPDIGRRAFVAGSAAALLARSGPASAADYPDRPITLIIPFPPGGSTTIVIRSVSDKLGEALIRLDRIWDNFFPFDSERKAAAG